MGLTLWIDQNSFASSLLEKVFKLREKPFYTLSEASDFVYLVEDLGPELIVLDSVTALTHLESFKTQYESSSRLQSLPFIWIDEPSVELNFVKNVIGKIERPFDPFEIPARLEKMIGRN